MITDDKIKELRESIESKASVFISNRNSFQDLLDEVDRLQRLYINKVFSMQMELNEANRKLALLRDVANVACDLMQLVLAVVLARATNGNLDGALDALAETSIRSNDVMKSAREGGALEE